MNALGQEVESTVGPAVYMLGLGGGLTLVAGFMRGKQSSESRKPCLLRTMDRWPFVSVSAAACVGAVALALAGCGSDSGSTDESSPKAHVVGIQLDPPEGPNVTRLEYHEWLLKELTRCARITDTPPDEAKESGLADYNACADLVNAAGKKAGW